MDRIRMVPREFKSARLSPLDLLVRGVFLSGGILLLGLPWVATVTGDFFLTCRFHLITGFRCPTCGMTRSFQSLIHLDIVHALQYHLLGPIIYILTLVLVIKWSMELMLRKPLNPPLNHTCIKISAMILAGVWLVFWLVRLGMDIFNAGVA